MEKYLSPEQLTMIEQKTQGRFQNKPTTIPYRVGDVYWLRETCYQGANSRPRFTYKYTSVKIVEVLPNGMAVIEHRVLDEDRPRFRSDGSFYYRQASLGCGHYKLVMEIE